MPKCWICERDFDKVVLINIDTQNGIETIGFCKQHFKEWVNS